MLKSLIERQIENNREAKIIYGWTALIVTIISVFSAIFIDAGIIFAGLVGIFLGLVALHARHLEHKLLKAYNRLL